MTSENNTEDNSNSNVDESQISVSDNIESQKKTKVDILTEELVEVGDRVFFDYDEF